jgi:hypothetical protein
VDPGLCMLSTDTIAVQEVCDDGTNATSSGLPCNGTEVPTIAPVPIVKLKSAGMPSHATSISFVSYMSVML